MNTVSRYTRLPRLEPSELNSRSELAPRKILDASAYIAAGMTWEYRVTQGERIDQIAYRVLGDSRLWWLIADLNPGIDPLELQPGVLILPRLEGGE